MSKRYLIYAKLYMHTGLKCLKNSVNVFALSTLVAQIEQHWKQGYIKAFIWYIPTDKSEEQLLIIY